MLIKNCLSVKNVIKEVALSGEERLPAKEAEPEAKAHQPVKPAGMFRE